jgi:hypothetical protein
MMLKKATLTFFIALSLLTSVSPQSLEISDINIDPSVLWLNEDSRVTVSARCIYNGSSISNADSSVAIKSPTGLTTSGHLWYSSGRYSSTLLLDQFSETGTYTAEVTCEYGSYTATGEKTFRVREMELDIIDEGNEIGVYMGDFMEIKIDFRVDGSLVSLPKDDFRIYIGDEEIEPISVVGTGSYQKISADICPSGNIDSCMSKLPEGLYDLEITAYYSGDKRVTSQVKNYVRINPPLKVDFSQSGVECVMGKLCNPDIKFNVVFPEGDISDLTEDDVSVRILGNKVFESAYIENMACDEQSGSCTLEVSIPSNLQPGSYDLFMSIKRKFGDSYYTTEDYVPLEVVLQLSGVMKDAAGDVVSTVITMKNEETGHTIMGSADHSGGYSLDILPGTYFIEISFVGTIARFSNVTISSEDFLLGFTGNLIRYDEGHLNSGSPPGVRIVKVIAVEFALPFSSAWFYVPYDSALVNGDENDLRVYKCDKWNFEKGFCNDAWREIDSDVHTIRNAVEFNAYSTSAFIIGEQRALYLRNTVTDKERVFIGDTVIINGKVMDNDGNPVEGAKVIASFPEFGITASDTSTTGGFFRVNLPAPYTDGYPDILIEATKSSYAPGNTTLTVGVDRKKDIGIFDVPETVEIKFDEPKSINLKIMNSGQINLTKTINLRVNGIPADWYRLSPVRIDELDINEQADINLSITLTPELCGGVCTQFSLVNIEAESEEVSDVASFTLRIVSPSNQTSLTQEEETGGGFNLPDVTGFSIALPSISNPYLPLTVIVILLILIVNKKKTMGIKIRGTKSRKKGKKSAPKLRDSVMLSVHRIKKEI